ncbi:MAG: type II toxin-antitoxin system ParD family antitoxin [Caulobacterales bacterium]
MRKTVPLTVTLTPKMAKAVKARVASGDYASESEVIRDGLRALEERQTTYVSELDSWLRTEGKKRAKALEAGETKLIPLDEAFEHLKKRATKRAQKKK